MVYAKSLTSCPFLLPVNTRVRAVAYEEFGGPLSIATLPDPVAPIGGVVVEVTATGLCRSDWHGWQGHDDDIRVFPHVPGHELAGVVVAVDSTVTRVRVGDRVTTPFVLGCGVCSTCEAGDQQVCPHQWQPGFHGWGSFAEYVALPFADTNLVRLPPDITDEVAASLGCRTATAYRGLVQVGGLRSGEQVAVFGCGGVGLSAVMIARSRGARVIAIDPSPVARQLARTAGAAVTLAPGEALVAEVVAASEGGVHLSLDAIGSPEVLRTAVLSLRRRGRHVQAGLLPQDAVIPMARVIAWELSVRGTHGMAAHDYAEMLADVAAHRLRPDSFVSRHITLDETPHELAQLNTEAQVPGVTMIRPGRAVTI